MHSAVIWVYVKMSATSCSIQPSFQIKLFSSIVQVEMPNGGPGGKQHEITLYKYLRPASDQ